MPPTARVGHSQPMDSNKLTVGLSSLALVLAAAAGGPVIAAKIVPNSDKVDGLDAVKASAPVKKRKNKLVATDKKGRLPNNIIKVAPDAARLGGFTAAQSRSIPLMPGAADTFEAPFTGAGGITLPDTGNPRATWTFVIPSDYRAGSPVSAEMYVAKPGVPACGIVLSAESLAGSAAASAGIPVTVNGNANEAAISFPTTVDSVGAQKVRFSIPSASLKPGMFLAFQIAREYDDPADNCSAQILVVAGQVRY